MTRRTVGLAASAAIALTVTLASLLGLNVGTFASLEPRLVDNLFPAIEPSSDIVVVAIDNTSISKVGRWPWDRTVHARLIDRLTKAGVKSVGYDVVFSDRSTKAADRAFGDAVRRAGNVVLGTDADYHGRGGDIPTAATVFPPIDGLGSVYGSGHVSVYPDDDGVVRRLAPAIRMPDGTLEPSLSLALAMRDPKAELSLATDGVRTPDGVVPTGPGHLLDINYTDGFETVSAVDVIQGRVPASKLRGKIVLVGATALGLGDTVLTPLQKDEKKPGVFVHANALNTILQGAYLHPVSNTTTLAWVFVAALIVALGISYLWLWLTPLVPIAAGAGYLFFALRSFDRGTVLNLVYPFLAIAVATLLAIGARYFTEFRERRRVTRIFGRYVSKDIVDEVLAAPKEAMASVDGASPEISVLFADLRGFTSASENLPPTVVVKALNAYLDAMTRAVDEERGTVDKFMGDCVMAFWNAPRPEPRHAERAVRAAIRMQQYIAEAMEHEDVQKLAVRGCGVGIATGEAVVGSIGSLQRADYTVIGDTVNTASRLCGVADAGEIVITSACADMIRDKFELGLLPPVSVKGKEQPLEVFRVMVDAPLGKLSDGPAPTQREPSKAAGYAPIEPVSGERPEGG